MNVVLRIAFVFCLSFLQQAWARAEEAPPNVLMIAIDDLNDWVGCMDGHPNALTPHIDSLARRGVLFTNAHCAAPVCNPSRVSVITGVSPATSGVYINKDDWRENENLKVEKNRLYIVKNM